MSGFAEARVSVRHEWAPGLYTLKLDVEVEPFASGQFRNLALYLGGQLERRAYSMASAPGEPLEFFLNRVDGGTFSPALSELVAGDQLLVEKQAQGFFTLAYVPPADEIWLIATGTGLAPFISMLRSDEPWQRFRRIVVVHGVREASHLAYRAELADRSSARGNKLIWAPVVSREPSATGVLHGRVTTALTSGELERFVGLSLAPERSHVMLCGNPEMVKDVTALLEPRGLRRHRVRRPGHVSSEAYW
jgi:ferredoxin/flavodoxin---NADP+ reductase